MRKASSNWLGKIIMATVMGVLIFSFAIWGVADVFKGFGQSTVASVGKSEISIELKYFDGAPVVREIARVSKPGRRVYVSAKSIPHVANGLGIAILSTPKGVMADHEAREQNVGGEILCQIF